jgi:hypothetical protein
MDSAGPVSKSPKEVKPAAFMFGLISTTPAQFPTGLQKPLPSSFLRRAGMDGLPPDNTQVSVNLANHNHQVMLNKSFGISL